MQMKPILHCLLVVVAKVVSSATGQEECAAPAPCICVRPPACYLWSVHLVGGFFPGYGGCDYTTVGCGKRALNAIPRFHNTAEHYDLIDLSSNNISRLEEYAFSNISTSNSPFGIGLFLDNNPISYMHEHAFAGMENISLQLYLRNTRLTVLPQALAELTHMTELTINGTMSLSSSVMIPLGSFLPSLDIDMYGWTGWPDEIRYLKHLKKLYIKNIPILPEHAFRGLEESLTSLEIKSATLGHSPDAICTLRHLRTISLYFVEVSSLELIPTCQSPLTTVYSLFFYYVDMLHFPSITATFPKVTSLRILFAKLKTIEDQNVSNQNDVTSLDLQGNELTRIPYAIKKMKNLHYLAIASNKITSVEAYDINNMQNLTNVYLMLNPINFVSEFSFVGSLSIRVLDLSDTNLDTIPRAILHLPNVQEVRLDGAPVECSCALHWLSSWDRLNVVHISGICHQSTETIDHFVKFKLHLCELSPIG